jgi:ribonuclease HI
MQPDPDRPEPDRRDGDPRFLTLSVDASFCHRTHAAGYGAWAKKATFAKGLIFGGPLPRGITNAGEAELGGIALALRYLLEREHLAGLDRLMVQSDSLRSLQLIARALPGVRIANHAKAAAVTKAQLQPSAMEAKALVAVKARVEQLDLLVRHVRGHKRGQKRQWVNRMCDAEARRHMLAERARLDAEVDQETQGGD